ncbi:sigma-54-dependent Fis family transcriptional regulator, partial [bacterium]|nr:sigma-54-dependent Fis family transcriptional regulator [bacterium]
MSGACPVNSVLLSDGDEAWLKRLSVRLRRRIGITNLITCSDPEAAMRILDSRAVSTVLRDFTMPRMTGDRVLSNIKANFPDIPVILLTGSNQVDVAVRCMQRGAFDYFVKTNDTDRILSGILRAIRLHEMVLENRLLSSGFLNDNGPRYPEPFAGLWTRSFRMLRIFRYLEAFAGSSAPVLITGESGSGKETLARALHASGEKKGEFVACSVAEHGDFLPDVLCGRRRNGLLSRAEGGALYLDGIEHLSASAQEFLSRLIDSPEYSDGSGSHPRWFTGRIIASTCAPLESISGMKRFLLRFNTHVVQIPPLRKRKEDLSVLLDCFLDEAAKHFDKSRPTPPSDLLSLLGAYQFPGNVREFREMVFEAVAQHKNGVLSLEPFRTRISSTSSAPSNDAPLVQFTG